MKKESLLNQLEQLRVQAEEGDSEIREILRIKIVDLLLDYIGNQEIRLKVEEIPL